MILASIVLASMTVSDIRFLERKVEEYRMTSERHFSSALSPFPGYFSPLGKPKASPKVNGMRLRWDGKKFSIEDGNSRIMVLVILSALLWGTVGVILCVQYLTLPMFLDFLVVGLSLGLASHIVWTYWRKRNDR